MRRVYQSLSPLEVLHLIGNNIPLFYLEHYWMLPGIIAFIFGLHIMGIKF